MGAESVIGIWKIWEFQSHDSASLSMLFVLNARRTGLFRTEPRYQSEIPRLLLQDARAGPQGEGARSLHQQKA
jgi:hypothetical protein